MTPAEAAARRPREVGSHFHLDVNTVVPDSWLDEPHRLYASGRDAVRAIVAANADGERRWRRIHVPTYFCHDATDAIAGDIEVALYEHGPLDPPTRLDLADDEIALAVEYFGAPVGVVVVGGTLIVDRTHDPAAGWVYSRPPEYVVASLRKYLPVPDGGVVWSPTGAPLPADAPTTDAHQARATDAILGMALKTAYLDGRPIEKAAFLSRLAAREDAIGTGPVSGPSDYTRGVAGHIDVEMLRVRRTANRTQFELSWGEGVPGFHLLDAPAYAVLVAPDGAARERVRSELLAADIYPAVLWPLAGRAVPAHHADLAERILVLHVDHRYSSIDIERSVEVTLAAARAAVADS